MAKLLDEIKSELPRNSGRQNRVNEILASLSPDDAADLQAALDDHTIPQVSIARVMQARGIDLKQSVICRYRKGSQ